MVQCRLKSITSLRYQPPSSRPTNEIREPGVKPGRPLLFISNRLQIKFVSTSGFTLFGYSVQINIINLLLSTAYEQNHNIIYGYSLSLF